MNLPRRIDGTMCSPQSIRLYRPFVHKNTIHIGLTLLLLPVSARQVPLVLATTFNVGNPPYYITARGDWGCCLPSPNHKYPEYHLIGGMWSPRMGYQVYVVCYTCSLTQTQLWPIPVHVHYHKLSTCYFNTSHTQQTKRHQGTTLLNSLFVLM
jgi:hypothetical protein